MFRKKIIAELQNQGLSRYALVKRLAGRIPERTVYAYLAGDCEMVSEKLAILCQELGLILKRSKKGRK